MPANAENSVSYPLSSAKFPSCTRSMAQSAGLFESTLSQGNGYSRQQGYLSLRMKCKVLRADDKACSPTSPCSEGMDLSSAPVFTSCVGSVYEEGHNPYLTGLLWGSNMIIPLKPLLLCLVRCSIHISFQKISAYFYIIEIALHIQFCLI